jgi:hypothetical protein
MKRVACGTGDEALTGLLSLSEAASEVLDGYAQQRATPIDTGLTASPTTPDTQDATMRVRTINKGPEPERTFASGSLTKDDTLGDLVGTLHELNQFFTEADHDEDGDVEVNNEMITPVRHGRMRTARPGGAGSRGTSMSSTEWNLGISPSASSDSEDQDHTLSPQVEAWRYVGGAASRHRARPSMSSSGSAQRGRNMFDLEEETTPSRGDAPRQYPASAGGQQRKPGQLRALVLGGTRL